MDEKIKVINRNDITRVADYIKKNTETLLNFYKKYSDLFLGYYLENDLIGICYGISFSEEIPEEKDKILLKHISILPQHYRKGYGSKLLKEFEKQVKKRGPFSITLGSADEISDKFYLKNKYQPTKYLIRVKKEKAADNYKDLVNLSQERVVDDILYLYVNCDEYNPLLKEDYKDRFNAEDIVVIFEKML